MGHLHGPPSMLCRSATGRGGSPQALQQPRMLMRFQQHVCARAVMSLHCSPAAASCSCCIVVFAMAGVLLGS